METEDQILKRYEAIFATIAALDRRYYLNRCASLAERRDYAARQVELEEMRSKLYSELASVRQSGPRERHHCRNFFRRSRA